MGDSRFRQDLERGRKPVELDLNVLGRCAGTSGRC